MFCSSKHLLSLKINVKKQTCVVKYDMTSFLIFGAFSSFISRSENINLNINYVFKCSSFFETNFMVKCVTSTKLDIFMIFN